jgi:hypothetical protein
MRLIQSPDSFELGKGFANGLAKSKPAEYADFWDFMHNLYRFYFCGLSGLANNKKWVKGNGYKNLCSLFAKARKANLVALKNNKEDWRCKGKSREFKILPTTVAQTLDFFKDVFFLEVRSINSDDPDGLKELVLCDYENGRTYELPKSEKPSHNFLESFRLEGCNVLVAPVVVNHDGVPQRFAISLFQWHDGKGRNALYGWHEICCLDGREVNLKATKIEQVLKIVKKEVEGTKPILYNTTHHDAYIDSEWLGYTKGNTNFHINLKALKQLVVLKGIPYAFKQMKQNWYWLHLSKALTHFLKVFPKWLKENKHNIEDIA